MSKDNTTLFSFFLFPFSLRGSCDSRPTVSMEVFGVSKFTQGEREASLLETSIVVVMKESSAATKSSLCHLHLVSNCAFALTG
ncbi:hypothetical protein K504DRAFT_102595 [Pleomassaria siparia CBS 279.74]|uniref:Secreted protein n=1 Tax=Pleomassaria siparia CBS 279.74 TaxID=1314801 RepID=A0A6G1JWB8_9PLEO|nr:hypothetical protein K504DRAFT_102595 [Pleomassaria siparia CBS 279.74]